jgi:hypothetical protein
MAKNSETQVVETTNENAPKEAVINNALSENNAEQQTAEGQNEAPKERKARETKEQRVELERERLEIQQAKAEKAAEAERCKPLIAEYQQTLKSGFCKLVKKDGQVVPATLSDLELPAAQILKIAEQQNEAQNDVKIVYWDFVKKGIRIATVADILSVDLVNDNQTIEAADEAIAAAKAAKNDLFNLEHYNK